MVTTPECDFYPAFAGGFLFEVDAGVRADGPLGSATSVPVLLRAEATGAESTSYVAIGDAAPNSILAVDVGIAFEGADLYTLVVDPYNEIAEADESNNEVIVQVEFLGAGAIPCYVA